MNQESLSHIANKKESPSADAVLDLVQMCQTFPYFSVPYIILSKHYASKNDFRTENTLFQAALRTPDRAWLSDYISGKEFQDLTEVKTENPSLEIQETVNEKSNLVIKQEEETRIHTEIDHPSSTKNLSNIEIDEKIEPSISAAISEVEEVENTNAAAEYDSIEKPTISDNELTNISVDIPSLDISANIQIESTISSNEIKFDKEPESNLGIDESFLELESNTLNAHNGINFDKEPESKFDLNEKFIENESDILNSSDEIIFDKEPESMFFVPSIEPEPTVETEDLEVEKTNRTWLFAPELTAEQETSKISIPEPEVPNVPKLTFSAGYNIEDYFKLESTEIATAPPSSNNTKENNDFFSWLNSGLANQGPMNKPAEVAKSSLIDKFIQENPSIQRPKKEFFSPEKAMKKSEVLDLNIATETLANIYKIQGYPEKAVKVYEQLQLKFPEKLSYFASLIEKLKLEHNL